MWSTHFIFLFMIIKNERETTISFGMHLSLESHKYQVKEKWSLQNGVRGFLLTLSSIFWETLTLALCLWALSTLSWDSTWVCKDKSIKTDGKSVDTLEWQVKALSILQMTMHCSVVVKNVETWDRLRNLNPFSNSQLQNFK